MEIEIGALALDVVESGAGKTVLLVHGSASDRRTWDAIEPELAEHFRVLSYSRRFHWPNPQPAGDASYVMAQHVDDLAQIVTALDDGPVDLVGHSYGGFIALLLAASRPDLVRRQVLIEPPVVPLFLSDPPKPIEVLRLLVTHPKLGVAVLKFGVTGLVPATKAAARGDMDRAIRTFGRAVLGQNAFDKLSGPRWDQVTANNIRAEYLSDSLGPLSEADVRSVQTPTLLLSGAQSPKLWPMLSDELDRLLPYSTRTTIADASHIAHEDSPEIVSGEIVNFFAHT